LAKILKKSQVCVKEYFCSYLFLGCHSNAKNSHSNKHWDAHPLKGKKEKRGREEDRA
jgi:hypothetical protein